MPRSIDEANSVAWRLKEPLSRPLVPQDPALAFRSKFSGHGASPGDEAYQPLGHVGVELIGDKDPLGVGVDVDRLTNVLNEVDLCSAFCHGRCNDFSGYDVEVGEQTQGAVSTVFELDAFNQAWSRGFRWVNPLKGLHPSFLIDTDDVCAFSGEFPCAEVDVADSLNGCVI